MIIIIFPERVQDSYLFDSTYHFVAVTDNTVDMILKIESANYLKIN